MATSDAILDVEEWISEHYFTTQAKGESFHKHVLDRRKEWDSADHDTPRSRFTRHRSELLRLLTDLYANGTGGHNASAPDAKPLRDLVLDILGYRTGEFQVSGSAPARFYNSPGVTRAAPLVVVDARPVQVLDDLMVKDAPTLASPFPLNEKDTLHSVSRLLSHLFVAEDGPDFGLVLAGRWIVVAERGRWPEGRYLAIDLQTIAERHDAKRGGELDTALTCLAADSLAPDADGTIWWSGVLEDSIRHTVGVSQDLREGVRLSIEIIANEVVARRRARGLPPLAADQAQPLARQSLRFIYRILFLLYAEASPELGVLPVGAPEYAAGYSLDRLRELTLVPLASPHARSGTHLYDSLAILFRLVDQGHTPAAGDSDASTLAFHPLRADLFRPEAIALISAVKLGNEQLQLVLRHLLLSKEQRGRDRGFISYVDLGINQLGAVYEGLMSYTGFFAETDLYEVARHGDPEKGSWVVPVDRAQTIAASDFVTAPDPLTGETKPVIHTRGTFVYRLSGRDRQLSASYYSPEVITRFVVSQALEELLDQDGQRTPARAILDLTVCEPALGSGAFAVEAVRQLAETYLTRRQAELGTTIDPDTYPAELQKVKAAIALRQVYGVDLNAQAVEFAEITLWLDTMAKDLTAPWFGLHLRRGDSLIGARHDFYTRAQVNAKDWFGAPREAPLTRFADKLADDTVDIDPGGRIHHFLLPAKGWGSTAETKEAKELAPERLKTLKAWRKAIIRKPTSRQLSELVELSRHAEALWMLAYRRLSVAEEQSRRRITLWGLDDELDGQSVTREQIEESLADENGAYRRLHRIMDAWCALWFWPLHGGWVEPPSLEEWIGALRDILGTDTKARKAAAYGKVTLSPAGVWQALADQEDLEIKGAGALPIEDVLGRHPWLRVCERVAAERGFFHWQLDFATVFAHGGFDLQVGNPPWVRPRTDVDALLAEGDPWWQLAHKPSEAERRAKRAETLALPGMRNLVLDATSATVATAEYVGSTENYPILSGLQPDLYRCFMEQTWSHMPPAGIVSLVHPESHFTDEKAVLLRRETYRRLRRHWQFINEFSLYELQHQKTYGVNVYAQAGKVHFVQAASLYHPSTVEGSLRHDGSGEEPGFKDPSTGTWDLRAHRSRIVEVDDNTLRTWHSILEDEATPVAETRMVYTVNTSAATVLENLAHHERIGSLGLQFSRGWDESIDRKKGYFVSRWGAPESWHDVILQGPHLYVATPMYKSPNRTMKHQQDWSTTDFETLATDSIPVTSYKPAGDRARYDADYTHWEEKPARGYYRLAWRKMAANTGERTLISAIVPPAMAHIHAVFSTALPGHSEAMREPELILASAFCSGLVSDFVIRSAPKSNIGFSQVVRLPIVTEHPLTDALLLRTLRLNCVVDAYADLWANVYRPSFRADAWTIGLDRPNRSALGEVGPQWTAATPLRIAEDRRNALVELDALVALMLGVSADQLCTIYRTQFAVLYGYDHHTYLYDANGRQVPASVLSVWRTKGERITAEERTATNQAGTTYVYELPFRVLDREADMRAAYAAFEARLTPASPHRP